MKMESVLIKLCVMCFVGIVVSVKEESETIAKPDSKVRDRQHIDDILKLKTDQDSKDQVLFRETIAALKTIYTQDIKPLEDAYSFTDMGYSKVSDAEMESNPLILLLGPWSSGKSTIINYLVGQDIEYGLPTGAEPVTSDFTIVMHGDKYKKIEGLVLATDGRQSFSSLEKYGKGFLERFLGIQMPHKILEKMTFVDTPGIIENRKQQERGYPYNEVCDWFIKRADLIFVVFDPTKLDIGTELESIFQQLKGHESQIRIIFNKADSMEPQELMRVYGALFWSLAPLIQVTEPPKVYIGSFWNKPFRQGTYEKLFLAEERSLLQDIDNVVVNQLEHKIATIRSRAVSIRIHALIINAFLEAFQQNRPSALFGKPDDVWREIVQNPKKFSIFKSVQIHVNVSKYDLPDAKLYETFFAMHAMEMIKPLKSHCPYFGKCLLEKIEDAIFDKLPKLLAVIQQTKDGTCYTTRNCGKIHNKYKLSSENTGS